MISLSIALSLSLPVAPQDSYREFQEQFKKAMEINASAQMAQLVKRNQAEAVDWIIKTAENLPQGSNEELVTRMAALRKAWKTAMETGFASKMEEYFSLLEPALLRERLKLKAKYDELNKDYWDNIEAKDGPKFTLVGEEFKVVAKNFAKIGDHYYSSQAWWFYGICSGEENRGDSANLYKAYEGAAQCVEERLLIELKDRYYLANKQIADHLKANGYDKEPTDEEGEEAGPGAKPGPPGAPKKPKASGAELVSPLKFQAVEDFDECVRPSYFADGLYPMWNTVYMTKTGTKGKVTSLGDLSPNFHRTGANEVMVDADGDGDGEIKVPLTGNMELVEFQIGEGEEKRDWACLAIVGMEKDLYQGFEQHLGVSDFNVSLYVFNAASVVGEVGGEKIQIIDDNGDGLFGSPPKLYAYAGLTKGQMQPDMDCVRIGKAKRAMPWSEYQQIGKEWYRLVVGPKGAEIVATPVTLETGTLKMKFKGGKPSWMVVKGKGKYEGCYYDLLANGTKGVQVPVGSYELFCGDLRKGKKRQTAKTLVLPGEGMGGWTVEAGKTTTVELGGDFSLEFAFEMGGEGVIVQGATVVVVGERGERYERPWNCRPAPEVSWRKVGARKGNKAERMKLITDQYVMMDVDNGWAKVWFPLDCEFDVNNFDAVQLQMAEKKNSLFGKLESEWKE